MIPFTDTHCHLDFERFDKDRDQVLKRAWKANLVWILNPGIDLQTNAKAIQLAEAHPEKINAAIGIHPNYGRPWTADILPKLRQQAQNHVVVAIGEIGLDYYRRHTPFDQQRRMFQEQLALAAELSLPVVIHSRDAIEDVLKILIPWQKTLEKENNPLAERPGVLHSYGEDYTNAKKAIDVGFYIGISGPVTFKNAPERKSVTRNLPMERLLLETDAPFLTPHPNRGKRNEPAYIPFIAEEMARLHNTSPKNVAEITFANAKRLFQF